MTRAGQSRLRRRGPRQALLIGELDVLQGQLLPVVLGDASRLFDDQPLANVHLEQEQELGGTGVTHIRYQLRRTA